jgi:hypothetical protein
MPSKSAIMRLEKINLNFIASAGTIIQQVNPNFAA